MDHALISRVKDGQTSFIEFKDKFPKRCLDLGTAVCLSSLHPFVNKSSTRSCSLEIG